MLIIHGKYSLLIKTMLWTLRYGGFLLGCLDSMQMEFDATTATQALLQIGIRVDVVDIFFMVQ